MSDEAAKRLPVRIRLPHATQEEFIEKYGSNVELNSIFIATKVPKPVGTLLSFELVLVDSSRLMRGEGTVEAMITEGRWGMRVHFTRIDQQTKTVVEAAVAARRNPSEIKQQQPAPIELPVPASVEKPIEQPIDAAVERPAEPVIANLSEAPIEKVSEPAAVATRPPERSTAVPIANTAAPQERPTSKDIVLGLALTATHADIAVQREGGPRRLGSLPSSLLNDVSVEFVRNAILPLKTAVEDELNVVLPRAVLAVPTSTTAKMREALTQSLKANGLEVVRIIHVPAALALAFAGGQTVARKRLLVIADIHGAVDAAAFHVTGDECEVIASHLGPSVTAADDLKKMLEAAKVIPQSLDELIVVSDGDGALQTKLQQLTGKTARSDIELSAISHGAALLGHNVVLKERGKPSAAISELLGVALGFANRSGAIVKVLEQQTRLPAEKSLALPAVAGTEIAILVMQGEDLSTASVHGSVSVTPDRNGEITLRFRIDADGRLTVTAESATGRHLDCRVNLLISEEEKARLVTVAPELGGPPAAAKGLFSGLKKMFGR